MLSIYLYSNETNEAGFLDISPETTLDIEALADIFDEDLTTGEFSLPLDVPWTDNNRRRMGFAERVQNVVQKEVYWRVDIYSYGFPEMTNAKLTLLEKVGNWSYKKGKFSASIAGTKGLFGSLIKNKKMRDLKLGGLMSWQNTDSRTFANQVMTGSFPQFNYISFAPVAIENFIATDRSDYDNEYLAKDTVNNVIETNSAWTFGRPSSSNELVAAAQGTSEYCDYRTVPFFRFKYVFKKIFEENGYQVQGAFLDVTEWDNLHIFNQCAIEVYSSVLGVDYNRSINPTNHIPDITQTDFIKAACSFFNVYLSFIGNNTVQLKYRETTIRQRKIAVITNAVSDTFDSTFQDSDTSADNGYKLQYKKDDQDNYFGERVKDVSDKNLVGSVATAILLQSLNIGRPLTTDDIAMVQAENMYYVVADATSSPVKWEPYAEELNDYVQGDGGKTIDLGLGTLASYVVQDPNTSLMVKKPFLGSRQLGTYTNNKGVKVTNPFSLRLFFIDMLSQNGQMAIPVSYNHNRDANNALIEEHSLALRGDEGIAKSMHTLWRQINSNMEIVKTSVAADRKMFLSLTSNDCLEINNVQFLPYKIDRSIPSKQSCEISIVPL